MVVLHDDNRVESGRTETGGITGEFAGLRDGTCPLDIVARRRRGGKVSAVTLVCWLLSMTNPPKKYKKKRVRPKEPFCGVRESAIHANKLTNIRSYREFTSLRTATIDISTATYSV